MRKLSSLCILTLLLIAGCSGPTTQYQTADNYTAEEYNRFKDTHQNEVQPNREVQAFNAVHARLGYQNAMMVWDTENCATYRATAPNGMPYSQRLTDASGQPICAN